jgi:peptidoglycan/xylan/chitin deacetylase (PgdA/CDA1 family)
VRALEHQLSLLQRRGYVGFTLTELMSRLASGTLPARSVAITFDDGYRSTLDAKVALDRVGYPATVFVVTDFVGGGERLSWPGIEHWQEGYSAELESLRWDDLELLLESGWEIGSHTRTHPFLPRVGADELEDELAGSREVLIGRLGRCDAFAYPYGGTTPAVRLAVASSGYVAACIGPSAEGEIEDPLAIPRVGLYGRDTGLRLRAKLSPRVYAAALRHRADVIDEPEPPVSTAGSVAHAGHDSTA